MKKLLTVTVFIAIIFALLLSGCLTSIDKKEMETTVMKRKMLLPAHMI